MIVQLSLAQKKNVAAIAMKSWLLPRTNSQGLQLGQSFPIKEKMTPSKEP